MAQCASCAKKSGTLGRHPSKYLEMGTFFLFLLYFMNNVLLYPV